MAQTAPIPPAASTAIRYRVADIQVFPAGNKLVLVHCQDTQATTLLRAEIADFLLQCQEFRTLDEHIMSNCQGRELSSRIIEALRQQLQHLTQGGFLLSQQTVSGFFQQKKEAQFASPPITSLCFPTCDRVSALEQCLVSYIKHCQRFERNPEYIIADDSASPKIREAYKAMLQGLKTQYDVPIIYAGLEEKIAYANTLSREGDIPVDIVSFLCLSDKQYGETTIGANRNALLLHTIGDLIFSVDDDMDCRIAPSPTYEKGLALTSNKTPTQVVLYHDRESALQANPAVEQDLLALHEQCLGQNISSCHAVTNQSELIRYQHVTPAMFRQLATGNGNILLTQHGVLGDCSHTDPDKYLISTEETLQQLIESNSAFHALRNSREAASAADCLTLTSNLSIVHAMGLGVDNRDILSPFPPLGRGEDIAFGNLLSACFPGAYAAYLPWTMLHTPLEQRKYQQKPQKLQIDLENWARFGMFEYRPGFAQTPEERLHTLGQYMEEIGQLPAKAFEQILHYQILSVASMLISTLEERLMIYQGQLPDTWVQHARAYISQLREEALLPLERLYAPNCTTALLQQLLRQFGQGLQWWPRLVETARCLRAEGICLAQPL